MLLKEFAIKTTVPLINQFYLPAVSRITVSENTFSFTLPTGEGNGTVMNGEETMQQNSKSHI